MGLKIAATSIDHEGEKEEEAWLRVTELGVAGFLARGFVFAMIGLFLLFAAVHSRSNEAKSFAGALQVYPARHTGHSCLALLQQGCSLSVSTASLRELTAGSLRVDSYHAVTTPFVARETPGKFAGADTGISSLIRQKHTWWAGRRRRL